jgi:GDP-L-fucose synthase
MNTLITGSSGILGNYFNFGFKPNKKELNLSNYEELKNYIKTNNITNIIHTDGKVGGVKSNSLYPYDYFMENMEINLNLIKVCKEENIKNILFLLSTCIFPADAPLPIKEEYLHSGEPHSSNFAYAYSKRMLEIGARCLNKQYGVNTACLIPCNLYGEYDNYDIENGQVISSLINKCYTAKLNNSPFIIWGSGYAEREFMYAGDLVKIITQINNENIIINNPIIVAPNKAYSIKDIVKVIVKHMNFNGEIIFDKSKPEGMLKKNSCNDEFKKYFSKFEFTGIDSGLEQTIKYFINNYDKIINKDKNNL